jgi:anti-anti-sigma regulatory factor
MEIAISKEQGKVPVTVVQLHGDVDASNYEDLIHKVQELMNAGAQDFVIDLAGVPFMSSAGLVSLHTAAIMLRGDKPTDPESGWAALKSIDRSRASGIQKHIKLLNPQEGVAETFEKAGFTQFFEIFNDLQSAVASF